MNAPDFSNRWLITGTLTTKSELHLGDGGRGEIHDRVRPKAGEEEHDAVTVGVDYQGRAFIPGSSLKGVLRACVADKLAAEKQFLDNWWRENKHKRKRECSPKPPAPWTDLLGFEDADSGAAVGGKLVFFDALHRDRPQESDLAARANTTNQGGKWNQQRLARDQDADRNRPFWDPIRRTCVAAAVSLDRRTRTAKENLLYHLEYVPADEVFTFEVSGENLGIMDVARLWVLLDQFNHGRATLGALNSNGWGRVQCEVEEIRRLDQSGINSWKTNPQAGLAACQPVDPTVRARIEREKALVASPFISANRLSIVLSLSLESPWLIRDPRQCERSERAREKKLAEGQKPPHAIAIHDEGGRPFVPAKSLRGALRSRGEMILRTLQLRCAGHPDEIPPLSSKGRTSDDVLMELRQRDLAARLFGLSGWLAPLHVPRLTAASAVDSHHQEFVAIDRFTGGAAEGLKFDAELAGRTTVTGTLAVDLGRLRRVDSQLASIGLLALVLRDLKEGDIPIGSGSAKGQGYCTADARVTHEGITYNSLNEWFASDPVKAALDALRHAPSSPMKTQP